MRSVQAMVDVLKAALPFGLEGVIFDCDGVLLNSRKSNVMYYNLVRKYFGLPYLSDEQEEYVHMHTSAESLVHILPHQFLSRLGEAMAGIDYMKDLVPHIVPEPGIFDLLGGLKCAGIKLAVHTNRTTLAQPVLEHFNLLQYFSLVVTAETHRPKPDPEGIFYILKSWTVDAKAALFVGDSMLDEEAARAAKVGLVSYCNPSLRALVQVNDYDYLLALIMDFRHDGKSASAMQFCN